MNRHDEAMERRLDQALREAAGSERAPDVTRAVLARFAAGDLGRDPAPQPAPRRRHWMAAALVLLGLGAVIAVFLATRTTVPEPAGQPVGPPQQGQGGIEVTTLAAIASLPVDARAVELRNLDDTAVKALVQRCPGITHLRVFASTAIYREKDDPPVAVSISDAALDDIGRLGGLQRLELHGTDAVRGHGLRQLENLPLLEDLELAWFDTDDDALQMLPRLPSLRRLSLSFNHGFGDRGIAAVAGCPGLHHLDLSHCSQLHSDSLRQLRALTHLRSLSLGSIGESWRGIGRPADRLAAMKRQKEWLFKARQSGAGMRVEALSEWPMLQDLDLSNCSRLGPEVGKRLREGSPWLRDLSLARCPLVDDTTVAELLGLRGLRSLDLSNCGGFSEHCLPLLVAATQLRELKLEYNLWLTLPQAERLFISGKRVTASRPGDDTFNAGMLKLAARYEARLSQPRYETVHSMAELRALPLDVTHFALVKLGDEGVEELKKRPRIAGLKVYRNDGRLRLSVATYAAITFLFTRLEELEFGNVDGFTAANLSQLQHMPSLRALHLWSMNREDSGSSGLLLQPLSGLRELEELGLDASLAFDSDAMDAIAGCKKLKSLSLAGCKQLRPDWIAKLGVVKTLESLDLGAVEAGVTDRTLMGLQELTNLRRLALSNGRFTSMGLQALAKMHRLETLDLDHNPELVTGALLHVPVRVQTLRLNDCKGLDPSAGKLLRDRFPELRSLSAAQGDWIDDESLAAILQMPKLEELDIRDCAKTTAKSFSALLKAPALRRLDATRCLWLTDELCKQLLAERPGLEVTRKVW